MPIQFGGPGVNPAGFNSQSALIEMQAGQAYAIPAGRWLVNLGTYCLLQEYVPYTTGWSTIMNGAGAALDLGMTVFTDGSNYRILNPTGLPTGSTISAAGSGYTSSPTVTASAGGSIWKAIIGGAINSTITVTNGGTGYVYPPLVLISPPPTPGTAATAYSTISAGVVTAVTLVLAGSGYTSNPTVTFINDPREGQNGLGTGTGAAAVAVTTGAGTMTGLVLVDPGSAVSAEPTLAFSGGGGSSAAATATGYVAKANDLIILLPT